MIEDWDKNIWDFIIICHKHGVRMGYDIEDFPESVKKQQQNISIKFSPNVLNLEIITNFSLNKSFAKAFEEAVIVNRDGMQWRVLSFDDLITSKIKAGRPKDLLDIQELQRAKNNLDIE